MIRWRLYLLAFFVYGLFWPLHHLTGIRVDLYRLAALSAAAVYLGITRLFGLWQSSHARTAPTSTRPRAGLAAGSAGALADRGNIERSLGRGRRSAAAGLVK
jgi:hypothetical protein